MGEIFKNYRTFCFDKTMKERVNVIERDVFHV